MRTQLALILVACSGSKTEPPPAAVASGSSAAPVVAAVADAALPLDAPAPSDAAASDDPKQRVAYKVGLQQGRKATDAKRWSEAIAGFDAAIAAKPGDARAISERGYARLLEGKDLEAAARDFDFAAGATKDAKLLSTIWYNRGLLEEKRGNAANAHAAFTIANDLRPTAAAQRKLAGKATGCAVRVARTFSVEDRATVDGKDWLALATALQLDDEPTTTEAALEALTGGKTAPKLPTVATGLAYSTRTAYLVLSVGGGLRAVPLGSAMFGRCPGDLGFDVKAQQGNLVHVAGVEEPEGGHTFMCEAKNGELEECTGKPGEKDAGTACLGGTSTARSLVVDATTGKVLLVAEQPYDDEAPAKSATVTLTPQGLKLAGARCDRTEPVTP